MSEPRTMAELIREHARANAEIARATERERWLYRRLVLALAHTGPVKLDGSGHRFDGEHLRLEYPAPADSRGAEGLEIPGAAS